VRFWPVSTCKIWLRVLVISCHRHVHWFQDSRVTLHCQAAITRAVFLQCLRSVPSRICQLSHREARAGVGSDVVVFTTTFPINLLHSHLLE
jgi:hypothetical protein